MNIFERCLIIDVFESMAVITNYETDSDIMSPLALSRKKIPKSPKNIIINDRRLKLKSIKSPN